MSETPTKPTGRKKRQETKEHLEVFDLYLKLGAQRSIAKLAAVTGRPKPTLQRWSRQFGWPERAAAWVDEATGAAADSMKKQFFREAENVTTAKYEILDELRSRIVGVEKKNLSIHELIAVLNSIKTELGEPTTITKGSMNLEKKNPFADLIDALFPAKDADKKAGTV